MEFVRKVLKDGLSDVHVPYAYGDTIILLSFIFKAATYPLTKQQVESIMAMQKLQPKIKAIQQRYSGNQVSCILKIISNYGNGLEKIFPFLLEKIHRESGALWVLFTQGHPTGCSYFQILLIAPNKHLLLHEHLHKARRF